MKQKQTLFSIKVYFCVCQHNKPDNINSLVINATQRVNLWFCNSCIAHLGAGLSGADLNLYWPDPVSIEGNGNGSKNKLKKQ